MKRALPLINEVRNPPTVRPLLVSGSTLARRLGPSGTRIAGEGQGGYGGKELTQLPATTTLIVLASRSMRALRPASRRERTRPSSRR